MERDYKELYEKRRLVVKRCYLKNREEILKNFKIYYQENKEEIKRKILENYRNKEKVFCEICNRDYININVHSKSKKHLKNCEE